MFVEMLEDDVARSSYNVGNDWSRLRRDRQQHSRITPRIAAILSQRIRNGLGGEHACHPQSPRMGMGPM